MNDMQGREYNGPGLWGTLILLCELLVGISFIVLGLLRWAGWV